MQILVRFYIQLCISLSLMTCRGTPVRSRLFLFSFVCPYHVWERGADFQSVDSSLVEIQGIRNRFKLVGEALIYYQFCGEKYKLTATSLFFAVSYIDKSSIKIERSFLFFQSSHSLRNFWLKKKCAVVSLVWRLRRCLNITNQFVYHPISVLNENTERKCLTRLPW